MSASGIGEIIGGSQREERLDILDARMTERGIDKEHYAWYRDLRRYGTVPQPAFASASIAPWPTSRASPMSATRSRSRTPRATHGIDKCYLSVRVFTRCHSKDMDRVNDVSVPI